MDRVILKVGTEVVIAGHQATITGLIFYWDAASSERNGDDLLLELEDRDGKRFSDVYYHITAILKRAASGDIALISVEKK